MFLLLGVSARVTSLSSQEPTSPQVPRLSQRSSPFGPFTLRDGAAVEAALREFSAAAVLFLSCFCHFLFLPLCSCHKSLSLSVPPTLPLFHFEKSLKSRASRHIPLKPPFQTEFEPFQIPFFSLSLLAAQPRPSLLPTGGTLLFLGTTVLARNILRTCCFWNSNFCKVLTFLVLCLWEYFSAELWLDTSHLMRRVLR